MRRTSAPRRGFVVVACLGHSRAGAGALILSKRAEDILWGVAQCLWALAGVTVADFREGKIRSFQTYLDDLSHPERTSSGTARA